MRRWMKVIHVASHYGDFSSEILNCSSHSSEGCSNRVVWMIWKWETFFPLWKYNESWCTYSHLCPREMNKMKTRKLGSFTLLSYRIKCLKWTKKPGQKVAQLLVACITKSHTRLFAIAGDECEKWRMLCSNFVMYISIRKLHDGWDR